MVAAIGATPTILQTLLCLLPLAEAAAREKLPPPTRAAAIMALIGIALLGMLLVVIILLGGHWVRRQGSYRRGRAVPADRVPMLTPTPGRQESTDSAESPVDGDGSASEGETIIRSDALRDEDGSS